MNTIRKSLLDTIRNPADICSFSREDLENLVVHCRNRIVESVSKTGGHLASSLGTVELTVALAHVFDFGFDKIVWDVGHQGYTYKILTGRHKRFEGLGKKGGLGKFLRREESSFDHFGAGHASTAISAALGMSVADTLSNKGGRTIAVIGDGAMTGGLAFEALNHAGALNDNLIVVLNDNRMSIDPNVGAFPKSLRDCPPDKPFNRFRTGRRNPVLGKIPNWMLDRLKNGYESLLPFFSPGNFFEKFNFQYFGPVDGHSVDNLVDLLNHAKNQPGPLLLHVLTVKGKGLPYAEEDAFTYHGVTPFEPATGKMKKGGGKAKSYTKVWSESFREIVNQDKKVVASSAAMISNTGLKPIREKYPDRIFDVGIAEGHAVTFSGGLATQGMKPFVVIYSTFLQRALDHIVHDIAIQNLPVRFILDRGGYVGADGATHHGSFDLTYLRMIPNLAVMVPKDGGELQRMVKTAHEYNDGPIALRFPRGNTEAYSENSLSELKPVPFGKGEKIIDGGKILFLAVGGMVEQSEKAIESLEKEGLECGLINARFVKPLDRDLILENLAGKKGVVVVEENVKKGGFGSAVMELFSEEGVVVPLIQFGMPDRFIEFASQAEQLEDADLSAERIASGVRGFARKFKIA